jgi:pilus assembly protein CpaF
LPSHERIVLVEDTSELHPHGPVFVRLEARAGTVEGAGRTDLRALVRAALRLRPDRIVVGEVRGAEAADMIWALSTGHRGSMSTIHADGPADALARLEVMVVMGLGDSVPLSAARAQVRNAIDVLVGVERDSQGARRVHRIDSFAPEGSEVLYERTSGRGPGGGS